MWHGMISVYVKSVVQRALFGRREKVWVTKVRPALLSYTSNINLRTPITPSHSLSLQFWAQYPSPSTPTFKPSSLLHSYLSQLKTLDKNQSKSSIFFFSQIQPGSWVISSFLLFSSIRLSLNLVPSLSPPSFFKEASVFSHPTGVSVPIPPGRLQRL